MKFIVSLVALTIILMEVMRTSGEKSCYSNSSSTFLNFGIISPYFKTPNKEKTIYQFPNCTAVQMWLVLRRGTSWPKSEDIIRLKELRNMKQAILINLRANHEAHKETLCQQDASLLKGWKFNITPDYQHNLTEQGRKDLFNLGKRLHDDFLELTSSGEFVFRHTDSSRTKESADYFAKGLFGFPMANTAPALPDPAGGDRLIYPFEHCPAWQSTADIYKEEEEEFLNSSYIRNAFSSVSQRLGFDEDLTLEYIMKMYDGCRYRKAWNISELSPWCVAFSEEELKVIEYIEDLKYYYKYGPGNRINLACPLVKDMVTRFSKVESEPNGHHPSGYFYFTHTSMIHMLSARLHLTYDAIPLRGDNYPEQQDRHYRTSTITPYMGNVMAVLWNCTGTEGDSNSLKVSFYQSEELVQYPNCSEGLCDWTYIKERFSAQVNHPKCTGDDFCFEYAIEGRSSAVSTISETGTIIGLTAMVFIMYLVKG